MQTDLFRDTWIQMELWTYYIIDSECCYAVRTWEESWQSP